MGDMTLKQHPQDASKTLYTYKVAITTKDASQAQAVCDTMQQQYNEVLLPGLAKVCRCASQSAHFGCLLLTL